MVLLLVMVFIYAYFPYKQRESVYKEMNRRIATLADTAALGIGIFFQESSYKAWSEIIRLLDREPAFAYIFIYDENKELFSSSPEKMERQEPLPPEYHQPVKRKNYIEIKVPINYKNNYRGDIILGMSLRGVKKAVNRINIISAAILAVIFTAAFFLAPFGSFNVIQNASPTYISVRPPMIYDDQFRAQNPVHIIPDLSIMWLPGKKPSDLFPRSKKMKRELLF